MSTESRRHIDNDIDPDVFEDLADRYEDGDEDDQEFADICRVVAQSFDEVSKS